MGNWREHSCEAWRGAVDVVFPRDCVHCGTLVEGSWLRHLCPACASLLHLVGEPHCETCGHPFAGEMEANFGCTHCATLEPIFGEGRTAVLMRGPARSLVHALKYHAGLHVLEDMAAIAAAAPGFTDYLRGAWLVPVPLHPRKERERQYNQSHLLAEAFARATGGEARVVEALRRQVDTESQTHYDREQRRRNLKNAFALAKGPPINPRQRYVLVDDVFTTGSTLNACAAALRDGGGVSIDVVTFGHG